MFLFICRQNFNVENLMQKNGAANTEKYQNIVTFRRLGQVGGGQACSFNTFMFFVQSTMPMLLSNLWM